MTLFCRSWLLTCLIFRETITPGGGAPSRGKLPPLPGPSTTGPLSQCLQVTPQLLVLSIKSTFVHRVSLPAGQGRTLPAEPTVSRQPDSRHNQTSTITCNNCSNYTYNLDFKLKSWNIAININSAWQFCRLLQLGHSQASLAHPNSQTIHLIHKRLRHHQCSKVNKQDITSRATLCTRRYASHYYPTVITTPQVSILPSALTNVLLTSCMECMEYGCMEAGMENWLATLSYSPSLRCVICTPLPRQSHAYLRSESLAVAPMPCQGSPQLCHTSGTDTRLHKGTRHTPWRQHLPSKDRYSDVKYLSTFYLWVIHNINSSLV